MSRLFIVGATGYIGSKLYLGAKNIKETLGTSSSGANGLLRLRLDEVNNFDYGKINYGDVVLLLAAISAPDTCANEYERVRAINVVGTSKFIKNILERGSRIVFFSSDTVYGEQVNDFDETAECNPAGEYAQMKQEVEQYFADNASFKSIRLSYVFSREDKFSQYLAGCVERNEEANLFHPFFRAIVHRDDVVEGVLNLATRWDEFPNPIINFGGPQVLSRIDFTEYLREVKHHGLRYKVSKPDAKFFKNRPQVIPMKSPIFTRLLGRPPRTLADAAFLEFNLS
jgi:dTDP-4-dehydrorhamnose reductase